MRETGTISRVNDLYVPRIVDGLLDELKRIPASQFEAVDASSLVASADSAAVRR